MGGGGGVGGGGTGVVVVVVGCNNETAALAPGAGRYPFREITHYCSFDNFTRILLCKGIFLVSL